MTKDYGALMREFLVARGIEPREGNGTWTKLFQCVLPGHQDRTPSANADLERGIYKCHSCDFSGGYKALVEACGQQPNVGTATDGQRPVSVDDMAREKQAQEAEADAEAVSVLDTQEYEWTHAETGAKYVQIVRRMSDGTKRVTWGRGGLQGAQAKDLFFASALLSKRDRLLVVEGAKCACVVNELGLPALALYKGGNFTPSDKALEKIFAGTQYEAITLWPDNDAVGETAIENLARALPAHTDAPLYRVDVGALWHGRKQDGQDIADVDKFNRMETIETAPEYTPPPPPEANADGNAEEIAFEIRERRIDTWTDTPPPRQFLFEGWLPRAELSHLSGTGGGGKSTLALQLSLALLIEGYGCPFRFEPSAYSMPFPRGNPQSGKVIVASWEDDKNEMRRRVNRLMTGRQMYGRRGELDKKLIAYALTGTGPIWEPQATGHMANKAALSHQGHKFREVVADERPDLLIIDPLAAAYMGDENQRSLVRAFAGELTQWARDYDCAVLVIAHPSKQATTAGGGVSGSTDWHASARSVWFFEQVIEKKEKQTTADGQAVMQLTHNKSSYAPRQEPIKLAWRGGGFYELTDADANANANANGATAVEEQDDEGDAF